MQDDVVGKITINLHGSVRLIRKATYVKHKVNLRNRKSGEKPYWGTYKGMSHSVEIENMSCQRIMPVTQLTWDYWMKNPPSFTELQKFGKGRKAQIRSYMQCPDYVKALCHVRDIAYDAGSEDVKLEL
jgi:hypothetical protein